MQKMTLEYGDDLTVRRRKHKKNKKNPAIYYYIVGNKGGYFYGEGGHTSIQSKGLVKKPGSVFVYAALHLEELRRLGWKAIPFIRAICKGIVLEAIRAGLDLKWPEDEWSWLLRVSDLEAEEITQALHEFKASRRQPV